MGYDQIDAEIKQVLSHIEHCIRRNLAGDVTFEILAYDYSGEPIELADGYIIPSDVICSKICYKGGVLPFVVQEIGDIVFFNAWDPTKSKGLLRYFAGQTSALSMSWVIEHINKIHAAIFGDSEE